MRVQTISRAVADLRSVCGTACPADAARRLTSLATHVPACARSGSLSSADLAWGRNGTRFRTSTGAVISLPAAYTAGHMNMPN
jgi:hypothetical protein